MRIVLAVMLAVQAALAIAGLRSTGLTSLATSGGTMYWALHVALLLPLAGMGWVLLAQAGPQAYGRVTGAAFACFAGLLPITALMSIFSGFAARMSDLVWLGYLYAFLGGFVLIGAVALFAFRAMPRPQAGPGWASGAFVAVLYVVAAHVMVAFSGSYEKANRETRERNAWLTKQAMLTINRCAATLAQAGKGYPPTLAGLGPQGAGCIDASLAGGKAAGYRIAYTPGVPDAEGRIRVYNLCATPLRYPRSGLLTLATQENGTYVSENANEKSPAALACERAYDHDPGYGPALFGTRHCAVAYAHANPSLGYPASAEDFARLPCTPGKRGSYVPGTPNAQGVRDRFEIHLVDSHRGRTAWFRTDETGVIRVAFDRNASRDDAPLAQLLAQEAADQKRATDAREATAKRAMQACDAGDTKGCDAYAEHLFFETNRIEEALQVWKRACAAGETRACPSTLPTNREAFHVAREFRGRCREGHAPSCEGLDRLALDPSDASARALSREYR